MYVATVEKNFLEMAKMLSEAYHGKYHEIFGFDSFESYCNTELDAHYRKEKEEYKKAVEELEEFTSNASNKS